MKAFLFISHGSRFQKTHEEIVSFVDHLKRRSGTDFIEYAFLDVAHPSILEGIDNCIQRGATEIVILLNFLNAGRHVDEDIPLIIDEARRRYPNMIFHTTDPVGQHEGMIPLFLDMMGDSGPETV